MTRNRFARDDTDTTPPVLDRPGDGHGDGHGGHEGDATIFATLYRDLRRFAAVCAPPEIDPDDLLQEAVARTLRRRRLVDIEAPAAYLRTAILNQVRNHSRTRWFVASGASADGQSSDVYPSDMSHLNALSADQRAAVFLLDIERLPVDEASRIVGCSPVALRARAARGRRALRRIVERTER